MTVPWSAEAAFHHALLAWFGQASGESLDEVRVYADDRAARLCHAAGAVAVTVGEAIFVDPGLRSAPLEVRRQVIAHEVIHVLQYRRARRDHASPARMLSSPDDAAEGEARACGPRLARGEAVRPRAVPRTRFQCVTMDNLKGVLSAEVYNEVAVSIRRQTDAGSGSMRWTSIMRWPTSTRS